MESFSLLAKVLWAPGETMLVVSKKPLILAPLALICVFSLLTGAAVVTKVDAGEMTVRQIERSTQAGSMSEEAKEQIKQRVNSPMIKGITVASTVVSPLLIITLVSAIYFGIFTMLGREGGFKAYFAVTSFAFIPGIFRQLAAVLTAFVVPSSSIMPDELGSLSPAVFLDRDAVSPILFAGVNLIDVVSIWILILLAIGFGFLTRRSLSKGARVAAVVIPFLCYAGFRLALAALRGV